jgi:hypothetical protein
MKANWSLVWEKLQAELNYQKVAPTVTYQDIALSILLDVTSKNQIVIDSVNFTEIYAASVTKVLNDEVILSDSVIKYVIKDYFGDTVPLTDVLGTFNVFLRDRFDEIRASDLESAALLNTTLVNGFLLNSPVTTASPVTVTPTKTDGVDLTTIVDVLAAVTNKIFSDTANISDGTANSISKYFTSGLSLDDFADINKSVNGVKGNIATMSDTINVSLIISRMLGSTTINEITLN